MIDFYEGYYDKKIPYLKVLAVPVSNAYQIDLLNIVNDSGPYRNYYDPLKAYLERRDKVRENFGTKSAEKRYYKVLLVSNDVNRIRKSAQILAQINMESNEDYEDDYNWEEEEDNLILNGLMEVDFGKEISEEKLPGNPYVIKNQACLDLAVNAQNLIAAGVLYKGLDPANLRQQCAALACDAHINVFVGIPEKLADNPEIQKLMYERGYDMIRLPDMDLSYYRKVADEMLEFGGVPFESREEKDAVINAVLRKCGVNISEEAISCALSMGRLRMSEGEKTLAEKHFKDFLNLSFRNTRESLRKMVGLDAFREAIDELVAVGHEAERNPKAVLSSRHMIFEGKTGIGKTMCAQIAADIMSAEGVTNGSFTVASRKDIIGKFVGHTAPKIASLFESARCGVIFVDEAGFFLNEKSGGFVEEAIKEFVRYMEIYRDVTVIFALYPGEAKRFLELDEGLRSRIARVVYFEDYSEDQLVEIFKGMLKEKGYRAGRGVTEKVRQYLRDAKKQFGKQFGNARECRKLCDVLVRSIALRHEEEGCKDKQADLAMVKDIARATKILKGKKQDRDQLSYGFDTGCESGGLLSV